MNGPLSSDSTVAYYDQNAATFSAGTESVDMAHLYAAFLPRIPAAGKVLDAGCGLGRDAAYFKRHGFAVTAFDTSRELAALASQTLGKPVGSCRFSISTPLRNMTASGPAPPSFMSRRENWMPCSNVSPMP